MHEFAEQQRRDCVSSDILEIQTAVDFGILVILALLYTDFLLQSPDERLRAMYEFTEHQ